MKKLSIRNSQYGFKSQLMCPFGLRLGHVNLNTAVIEKLLSMTNKILSDKNRISRGDKLVGQIQEEPDVSFDLLKEEGLYDLFLDIMTNYDVPVNLLIVRINGDQFWFHDQPGAAEWFARERGWKWDDHLKKFIDI